MKTSDLLITIGTAIIVSAVFISIFSALSEEARKSEQRCWFQIHKGGVVNKCNECRMFIKSGPNNKKYQCWNCEFGNVSDLVDDDFDKICPMKAQENVTT